jgi:[protein-PII] uridylyltransferase
VGKGLPGDHSIVGAPLAANLATDMGFPPDDVVMIARLVRLHLLLPDVATRRDLSDPVTITDVAEAVGDVETLDLLHALCRADSAATGPAVVSPWRFGLIKELVEAVRAHVTDGTLPPPPTIDTALVNAPLPAVDITESHVTVAAADRRGLLADVAGALALHRLDVIGADVTTVGDVGHIRLSVSQRYGSPPDRTRLDLDLRRAAIGDLPMDRLVRGGRTKAAAPVVSWHRDVATDAVVLEVRAADAPGLLYRITSALATAGADVRAARVATLGAEVVDAFYLVGAWVSADDRVALTDELDKALM